MILSPHPDDAELGAGGTIEKMVSHNYEIHWLTFCDVDIFNELEWVWNEYDIDKDKRYCMNLETRKLPLHRQEILDRLYRFKEEVKPDLVIGPSLHDFHQDHKTVATEMVRAFKATSTIISYELPWNHLEFDMQMFVPLSKEQIATKWEILQCYQRQIRLGRYYFKRDRQDKRR